MSHTFGQIKEHLLGMGHGGTLSKVRNIEAMAERTASVFVAKSKPLETIRLASLDLVYDDVYDYSLPADFNSLMDLYPQDNRNSWDKAFRMHGEEFDLRKAYKTRTISIEGAEGTKKLRLNWRSKAAKVLHTMDSVDGNGTWTAVGTATGIVKDDIFKIKGSASIKFNLVASGDGIQNTTMSSIDLTDEDEVSAAFVWVNMPIVPTSVSAFWGNDLTTNYWTATAQTTQADGSAFKVGWNRVKFPWDSTATESGTVDPSVIDSFKITAASGTVPINNMRVDDIRFSIGRNFDIKYYSKFLFKDADTGVYSSRPASDTDIVLVDNDSLPIYLFELLKSMAHQVEGTDSAFDIDYAKQELEDLYPSFRSEHPDQRKKIANSYGNGPRWGGRGRGRNRVNRR